MWTGAMWTSQTLVTTQRHPNQGLVGSGLVRRVIPMGRRSKWMRKKVVARRKLVSTAGALVVITV